MKNEEVYEITRTLNAVRYIRTPSEEKPSKMAKITFAIFFFLIKILQLNCHPEYLGVSPFSSTLALMRYFL